MVFNQVEQSWPLSSGVVAYTLGAAGSLATTGGLRAQKITAWRAASGDMTKGGEVLAMEDFGAAATMAQAQLIQLATRAALKGVIASVPSTITTPIPSVVGADTSYPSINIRVFPPPSSAPGVIELHYWTPIASFSTVGDTVSLPPGYEDMLHFNLAVHLAPQYARATGITQELAANAQNSKAAIIQQNTMMRVAPPPQAAPQKAA